MIPWTERSGVGAPRIGLAMRLGFRQGWVGRRRKIAVCPNCGSRRARPSRRLYQGLWFLVFKLRPVKCSDCGFYFPIPADGSIGRWAADSADLGIPFRPLELDDPPEASGELVSGDKSAKRRGQCPGCGSYSVRSSNPGDDRALLRRFEVRDGYRCLKCNASFRRINLLRLTTVALVLVTVLAGLSYFGIVALGRPTSTTGSPGVMKDKVPRPPPPVFR